MPTTALAAVALLLFSSPEELRMTSASGSTIVRTVENQGGRESVIEFRDAKGTALCQLDYSSDDGNHGFKVVKAAWTADGRFFVWSLQSSGGHSPWHFPTFFFDSRTQQVRNLDDYIPGPGISEGEFKLGGRNTVFTTSYSEKRHVGVRFQLKVLTKSVLLGTEVRCSGGLSIPLGERHP